MDIDEMIKNAKEDIIKEDNDKTKEVDNIIENKINNNDKTKELSITTTQNEVGQVIDNNAMDNTLSTANLQSLQKEFLKKQIDNGKTLNEITTDFAHATITNEIFSNDTKENVAFKKELKVEKKEAIKETFIQEKVSKQTKTIEEKQNKAEAFYKSFRPILEFDFSNLIKTNNEIKEKKEYEDRSYGIALMCLMLFLYTPLYCVISLVLALFNGVNAIFTAISNFGKIAKSICYTIFIIGILVLLAYLGIVGIEKLFNITIIPKLI